MPGSSSGDARQQLRTRTSASHARLDAHFPEGLKTPEAYACYLAGMHRFATDYEVAVGLLPRHSFWLARDLQHCGITPLPPSGIFSPVSDAVERLGWDYVMAGSSMGARYLVRQVQAMGHQDDAGASFLTRHAASDDWTRVLDRLAAFSPAGEDVLARMEHGAREAFAFADRCFERGFAATPVAPDQEPLHESSP